MIRLIEPMDDEMSPDPLAQYRTECLAVNILDRARREKQGENPRKHDLLMDHEPQHSPPAEIEWSAHRLT